MKTLNKPRYDSTNEDDELGKVFVGGLSWETTTASLQKYFMKYGTLTDCVVMKNQLTGRSRGFGFVTFEDVSLLDKVMADKPHIIDNRQGGKSVENNKRKVFVGGLPSDVTDQQLKEIMSKYGPVIDAVIMFDHARQKTRGFGFVTFEKEESVAEVCKLQYVIIKDKQVEVKRAEPREVHSVADKSHLLPAPVSTNTAAADALTRRLLRQQLLPPLQHILVNTPQPLPLQPTPQQAQPQTASLLPCASLNPNYSMLSTIIVQNGTGSELGSAGGTGTWCGTYPQPNPLGAAAYNGTCYTPYTTTANGTIRQLDYATQPAAGYVALAPPVAYSAAVQPTYQTGTNSCYQVQQQQGSVGSTLIPAHNSAPGLLGSYPSHDGSSMYVPAGVRYMAGDPGSMAAMAAAAAAAGASGPTGTGGGGCTYLNFSPQVTNTLTPGMTPVPGGYASSPTNTTTTTGTPPTSTSASGASGPLVPSSPLRPTTASSSTSSPARYGGCGGASGAAAAAAAAAGASGDHLALVAPTSPHLLTRHPFHPYRRC